MADKVSLYRTILQGRQDLYNEALAKGVYTPFILPWDLLPAICLILGILITPQLPRPYSRWSRMCLYMLQCTYSLLRWPYIRTIGMAAGYGIGLSGFWGVIMSPILLILHDPAKDFERIEVRKGQGASFVSNHSTKAESSTLENNDKLNDARKRTQTKHESAEDSVSRFGSVKHAEESCFVKQGYPHDLLHRLDWSVDLMTSFRGINWNFRIPIKTYIIPPPNGDPPTLPIEAAQRKEEALHELRRTAILNFVYYYLVIDTLKTFMVTDPYWLGIAPLDSSTPWAWLASLNNVLPGATRFIRLSLSLTSVVAALTIIFSLSPLFFATVLPCILNDEIYTITKSPLLEVWMYPAQWGNMFETLCNKGLAGMWSTWWHQMFRFGISEPSRLLMLSLNIPPKSQVGRAVQLFVAFGLTASIHAAASSTTFSILGSKPWNAFFFFVSQAVGILIQTEASQRLNRLAEWPRLVRQSANFGFVFVFMWYTGPLLADDFARCQIWLFEPIPVSFLRGLGFGPGDCWFPWFQFPTGGGWLGWWSGSSWYNSGLAIF